MIRELVEREAIAAAGALASLVGDAALCRRIGAANRAKAERDYDERDMVEAYRGLFAGAG